VARAALEHAVQHFGAGRRGRGAWNFRDFGRWGVEPAQGRRNKVGKDRDKDEEKEGTMPRFGRGFPGFERPHGKHFDRGDVKYVLLDLLREGPRHGYDMIKELEQRSGGLYSPSPGSVYPTLQMLEDQGLVTSTTVDGKRTYRLTDAGYAFIEERKERTHDARGRSWLESEHFREELRSMGREAGELARSLRHAVQSYTPDPQQMKEIRDVIGETRKRIEAILAERREAPRDEDHGKPTVV
jgi:DNA-binding PadR family transcriptional regulator